jgi:hypothetical protein
MSCNCFPSRPSKVSMIPVMLPPGRLWLATHRVGPLSFRAAMEAPI